MLYDTEQEQERVILVAIETNKNANLLTADDSLTELAELANTANCLVVGTLIQNREKPHPKHYIGKGKLDELLELCDELEADTIICDDELSSIQLKHLEKALGVKIVDRTLLILDIFATRAASNEGKIQVELAQLKYRQSHMYGIGAQLARLKKGVGTRGPGEKKLETDKRYIQGRVEELEDELAKIKTHRDLLSKNRERNSVPVIALVGYTNAGKSTLLNTLTNADVLAEDKLFATLDTTTRRLELPNGSNVIVTDTVGFIQKLPHTLVKAFRSTLEELEYADILIHVVDAQSVIREAQITSVERTLQEIKVFEKPKIIAFNKIDGNVMFPLPEYDHYNDEVHISALNNIGITDLTAAIENVLQASRQKVCVLVPYSDGVSVSYVHDTCELVTEEFRETGTYLEFYGNEEAVNKLAKYSI